MQEEAALHAEIQTGLRGAVCGCARAPEVVYRWRISGHTTLVPLGPKPVVGFIHLKGPAGAGEGEEERIVEGPHCEDETE
ncbi:hypothetical protein NDU88_002510 [Pleurodeles waltl]|uniref:Uncharacterized protein n=1 Tax=Pleurodeles waltl TaxID=8319 RepID=A0AAV7M3K4_PLEWA|nr:hypothetical protein NDU88_002510 [Pleurodeles waltl]